MAEDTQRDKELVAHRGGAPPPSPKLDFVSSILYRYRLSGSSYVKYSPLRKYERKRKGLAWPGLIAGASFIWVGHLVLLLGLFAKPPNCSSQYWL